MSTAPQSIEATVSPDGGNVPAMVEPTPAPSPTPQEPAPAAAPAEPVATPVPELFELPDGRKVDGGTLAKEFKENFLPDYTRKSQELARLTTAPKAAEITTPADPLADPNYVPTSYAELIKIAKDSVFQEMASKQKEAQDQQMAIEKAVEDQLNAVKAIDKTVNENALFLHATKYGFRDLTAAHRNMTDMARIAKETKQATAKEVLKRNDPVSVIPGGSGGKAPDPSQFANARDYLRSLK